MHSKRWEHGNCSAEMPGALCSSRQRRGMALFPGGGAERPRAGGQPQLPGEGTVRRGALESTGWEPSPERDPTSPPRYAAGESGERML